jgi:hypothetical protein
MRKMSEAAVAAGLASDAEREQDPPNVRVLKYVVIFLGVLLIGCLVAVFAIIGYRLANRASGAEDTRLNELELAIGANAQIGQIAVDGNRMTLYVKGVTNDELLVIDTSRGRLISRIRLTKSSRPGQQKW